MLRVGIIGYGRRISHMAKRLAMFNIRSGSRQSPIREPKTYRLQGMTFYPTHKFILPQIRCRPIRPIISMAS
jgi:hypothetical protein